MQLCSTAAVQARSRDTDCGKMDRMIELCGGDCDFSDSDLQIPGSGILIPSHFPKLKYIDVCISIGLACLYENNHI